MSANVGNIQMRKGEKAMVLRRMEQVQKVLVFFHFDSFQAVLKSVFSCSVCFSLKKSLVPLFPRIFGVASHRCAVDEPIEFLLDRSRR